VPRSLRQWLGRWDVNISTCMPQPLLDTQTSSLGWQLTASHRSWPTLLSNGVKWHVDDIIIGHWQFATVPHRGSRGGNHIAGQWIT